MKLPHKIILPVAAIALVAAGAVSTVALQTRAQTVTNQMQGNPMSNLVNAIAQKFGLKTSDVQQVFDEQHAQMDAQRQQDFTDRINQDAKDGKLTQDQADKIIAKLKDLEVQREANKNSFANMTDQQRHDTIQKQMSDLRQWAQDNNIPMQYLMFGHMGHGMGRGMGRF